MIEISDQIIEITFKIDKLTDLTSTMEIIIEILTQERVETIITLDATTGREQIMLKYSKIIITIPRIDQHQYSSESPADQQQILDKFYNAKEDTCNSIISLNRTPHGYCICINVQL